MKQRKREGKREGGRQEYRYVGREDEKEEKEEEKGKIIASDHSLSSSYAPGGKFTILFNSVVMERRREGKK